MFDNALSKWSLAGLLVMAMGTAGCAARSDVDAVAQNEQSIREMIANDQQQMIALQQQVAKLNDRVTELQHNGTGPRGKQLGEINSRLAKLESQVNGTAAAAPLAPGVPGAPGAPTAAAGAATASLGPANSESAPAAAPAQIPAVPGWHSALDQELAAAGNNSEAGSRIYRDGLIDMKAGRYAGAVGKFQAFQRAHPKSSLAEPAEYFSANALFEMGPRDPSNYNQAILQFNDLAMRYPKGRFAAGAQLREAQAFLRTNDSLDAKLTLQKLVRDYPGSSEAAAADAMMKSMASN